MPDTDTISAILDLLDGQLERELAMAEKNPLWFGSFPGQTRAHIRFFAELTMSEDTGGNET